MDPIAVTRALKQEARRLGFDRCRIVPVQPAPHAGFFADWIAAGRAGDMHYLARYQAQRGDPALLADAGSGSLRSLIVLAVNHYQFALPPDLRDDPSRGLIASYAWGDDYHDIIKPQLHALDAFLARHSGRATHGKCLVDSGPVLERDWAQAAGLGFTGKNCCTIHPEDGSWLLLATVLVPEVLAFDPPRAATVPEPARAAVLAGLPHDRDYGAWALPSAADLPDVDAPASLTGTCGRCTRCLDACPTAAFVGPFHLDPQRCISYWTIETQAPIPRALRPAFGNRIFGCDICQEVCPWNRRLPTRTPRLPTRTPRLPTRTPRLPGLVAHTDRVAIPLLEGFAANTPYWLRADAFAARFRRSPILRGKRHGLLRSVCVALGNWADPAAVPALTLALADPEPVVRGHAAWGLGQVLRRHTLDAARAALAGGLRVETDAHVQEEIRRALAAP